MGKAIKKQKGIPLYTLCESVKVVRSKPILFDHNRPSNFIDWIYLSRQATGVNEIATTNIRSGHHEAVAKSKPLRMFRL